MPARCSPRVAERRAEEGLGRMAVVSEELLNPGLVFRPWVADGRASTSRRRVPARDRVPQQVLHTQQLRMRLAGTVTVIQANSATCGKKSSRDRGDQPRSTLRVRALTVLPPSPRRSPAAS